MKTVQRFQSANDFWDGMLVPDYEDFRKDVGNLRKALHSANSLFHMHDWVFSEHKTATSSSLLFNDQNNEPISVSSAGRFATALEQIDENFKLIRGIANAGKHLALEPHGIRPHPDAPSNAANTSSQSLGFGEGAFGIGPYGGGSQVMLEGATGHLHFSQIAKSVYEMWVSLKRLNNW